MTAVTEAAPSEAVIQFTPRTSAEPLEVWMGGIKMDVGRTVLDVAAAPPDQMQAYARRASRLMALALQTMEDPERELSVDLSLLAVEIPAAEPVTEQRVAAFSLAQSVGAPAEGAWRPKESRLVRAGRAISALFAKGKEQLGRVFFEDQTPSNPTTAKPRYEAQHAKRRAAAQWAGSAAVADMGFGFGIAGSGRLM